MLKIKTAPTIEPVSLLEAQEHLRIDVDDDAGLVTNLITAAREYCEGFQRRAFISQTWYLYLDEWPEYIEVPLPPLQSSGLSITYYDTANAPLAVSSGDYYVDTNSTPGRIILNYGKTWPSTTLRSANGICVEFIAGYGATAATVPASVRQAMLLLIAHWYENREALSEKPLSSVPMAVESLLWMERVF